MEMATAVDSKMVSATLGVLIFTAPREWGPALVIARGVFFIVGFILTSKIFWDRSQVG